MYSTRIRKIWAVILWLGSTAAWAAQAQTAQQSASASPLASQEGDFVTRTFRFRSGEVLPQMTLHYATLGAPKRDATGRVTNAVLILHGTGGSGRNFLSRNFPACSLGRDNCWMRAAFSSSFRIPSATAARANRATARMRAFRNTTTPIWFTRSTCSSLKACV